MNLAEALNSALPELPVNKARIKRLPKMDPKLIGRLQTEEGKPVVVANMRGTTYLYRFSPEQWELIQMFDGERTYAEVAQLFTKTTGARSAKKTRAISPTPWTMANSGIALRRNATSR